MSLPRMWSCSQSLRNTETSDVTTNSPDLKAFCIARALSVRVLCSDKCFAASGHAYNRKYCSSVPK